MANTALVIVSGGAAISPFTTPEAACAEGQPAGSTDSFLRAELLAAGHTVYTAPATAGDGPAEVDTGFAGFAGPPEILSPEVTVNSVGPIDEAGTSLASFLELLTQRFGHDRFHLVAHSMGGLFSLAAINQLPDAQRRIGSVTTIGTPWRGGFAADFAAGDLELSEANGDATFEQVLTAFAAEVAALPPNSAGEQVSGSHVDAWRPTRSQALSGHQLTLIAGEAFAGTGRIWPNDGLVTRDSALATGADESVFENTTRHTFADAHSIYFADLFGLPWERALTWDPAVSQVVRDALANQG